LESIRTWYDLQRSGLVMTRRPEGAYAVVANHDGRLRNLGLAVPSDPSVEYGFVEDYHIEHFNILFLIETWQALVDSAVVLRRGEVTPHSQYMLVTEGEGGTIVRDPHRACVRFYSHVYSQPYTEYDGGQAVFWVGEPVVSALIGRATPQNPAQMWSALTFGFAEPHEAPLALRRERERQSRRVWRCVRHGVLDLLLVSHSRSLDPAEDAEAA
jgi:hypothetical protein